MTVESVPTRTVVFVESWQQQCCGDEFGIGSHVRWNVHPAGGTADQMTSLVGPPNTGIARYWEDHHGMAEGGGMELRGVVRSIHVVSCDLELRDEPGFRGRVRVPVAGSERLRAVDVADPSEPERQLDDSQSFQGWIVELDAVRG
jgi:hypothetical protein